MQQMPLPGVDGIGIRADNPGPFTLEGTNSWLVGRDPAWLIDPGPALDEHIAALRAEIERRGGLGGIALTHDHQDHAEAVPVMRTQFPHAMLAGARGEVDVKLFEDPRIGPLTALPTPGHSPDHVAFLWNGVGFSGDAVLGQGSVFIFPDPGALAGYLRGLEDLRGHNLELLAPGHGLPVDAVQDKLDEYVAHRLERERRLIAALGTGKRTVEELLDDVWADVPAVLRPAASVTLAAHLDKLADEARLPEGVERPTPWW